MTAHLYIGIYTGVGEAAARSRHGFLGFGKRNGFRAFVFRGVPYGERTFSSLDWFFLPR